jgi:hypothetical protein
MEFWLESDLDVIFWHEIQDQECLMQLPFFGVCNKEWRSFEFWGWELYPLRKITTEEWLAQTTPRPRTPCSVIDMDESDYWD